MVKVCEFCCLASEISQNSSYSHGTSRFILYTMVHKRMCHFYFLE